MLQYSLVAMRKVVILIKKAVKYITFTMLLGLIILLPMGCGDGDVVAEVNGEKISRAQLDTKIGELEMGLQSQGFDLEELSEEQAEEVSKNLQKEALNQLIDEAILMQQAEKMGVKADEKQAQEELKQFKEGLGEETYKQLLEEQGLTEKDLLEHQKLKLSYDALFKKVTEDVTIDDHEVKSHFDENREDLEQLKVAHILISVEPDSSEEEIESANQKAKELIEQLNNGSDFGELAKEHSDDTQSANNDGSLEVYFSRQDPFFVAEFTEGAFQLDKGQFSPEPVRSDYGFHIIKVLDKKDSYEELKEPLEERLLAARKNEVFNDFFTEAKEKSKIENKLEE